MKLRIGSRKSRLAIWQTTHIATLLTQAHPGLKTEIVTMDTLGDRVTDMPLPKIGSKGLFTQELEDALRSGDVDMAVHSLKDLPTILPEGLAYVGSPERAAATDAFISSKWKRFDDVPPDGVIATGSLRRKAQLLSIKPGLRFESLRGNIDTRLRKLEELGWDGIIMATAALDRLDRPELVAEALDPAIFVPAVSQGAIGIEASESRDDVRQLLSPILHGETVMAVSAERTFMRALEGGCSVPLGAHCVKTQAGWSFRAWVGAEDGRRHICDVVHGKDPLELAEVMVEAFRAKGADAILGR